MPEFSIISDVHLEFIPDIKFDNFGGENLLLCGDIGKPHTKIYKNFIKLCSESFQRVFIICGNHEYYGFKRESVHSELETLAAKFNNVYFMNDTVKEFDDFTIIGATLWSNIPPSIHEEIRGLINDYRYIYKEKGVPITPVDTCRWHHSNVNFIKKSIEEATKPVVVMTHHAPLFNCVKPEYLTNKNHAFCSDLHELFKPNVKLWAFGHTHCPFQMDLPTDDEFIHLHNNPVGYPHELDNYNPFDLDNFTWGW